VSRNTCARQRCRPSGCFTCSSTFIQIVIAQASDLPEPIGPWMTFTGAGERMKSRSTSPSGLNVLIVASQEAAPNRALQGIPVLAQGSDRPLDPHHRQDDHRNRRVRRAVHTPQRREVPEMEHVRAHSSSHDRIAMVVQRAARLTYGKLRALPRIGDSTENVPSIAATAKNRIDCPAARASASVNKISRRPR
jgi:hypothetical protein